MKGQYYGTVGPAGQSENIFQLSQKIDNQKR
jgi:hypothetical protein